MKNVFLICVGKLKSDVFKKTEHSILKNSRARYNLRIIEVDSEKNHNIDRESEVEIIKEKEADRILKSIPNGCFVVTLEITGKKTDSLPDLIDDIDKDVCIIIGGSVGLSVKVSKISDMRISFSDMTFPHALVRQIVLEQLMK